MANLSPPPAGVWSKALATLALLTVLTLFILWPNPEAPAADPAPATTVATETSAPAETAS